MGADRLPALEAVAEALAAVNDALGIDADITVMGDEVKAYVSAEDGGRVKTYFGASECRRLSAAFASLAARLDATPAAQSPTPTPTDEELRDLWMQAYADGYHAQPYGEPLSAERMVAEYAGEVSGRRAIYDAGRAACVARLREQAALEAEGSDSRAALIEMADALESER